MATRPHVWQLVEIGEDGARELLGLHVTSEESAPEPGHELTVEDVEYEVVGAEPAHSATPHEGPEQIEGILVVRPRPAEDRS
jgi:hypothetical protein